MNTSIQRLYDTAQRAKSSLQNLRARERKSTSELMVRVGTAASVVAGGVLAGAIDGKWGHDGDPATEHYGIAQMGPFPMNLSAGLVLTAVGLTGAVPGAEYVSGLGASMVSFSLGKTIENKILEKAAK